MKTPWFILTVASLFAAVGVMAAPPVIPGLHGRHPLGERQRGELLIRELRCAACHEGMPVDGMKEAPDLGRVGLRLTPAFMEKFIADPAAVHRGTTMPGLLGAESEEKRREMVDSIVAYLTTLKGDATQELPVVESGAGVGRELFHSIGCVACHSPRDDAGKETIQQGMVSLAHLPGKYQAGELAAFLHAPLEIRPSGRMPDMKLSREEASAVAAYLEGTIANISNQVMPEEDQVRAGKLAFQTYQCAACHQVEQPGPDVQKSGPPLPDLDPTLGCLSETPGAAPDFHLSALQRNWIRLALAPSAEESSPDDRIKMQLTQMNCIACHVRDDFGGVRQELDGYFDSSEKSLGNEARIPPPLTSIGAKLRPEWMNAVLYDGRSVRPYMTTRMPLFGESGLAGLTDLFSDVDDMDALEIPIPDRKASRMLRDEARGLLGDKGLNCIACHNHNGKESPGMKGLDLMTSYQRLQPEWFFNFMKNPASYRPGIIMPNYWPDGKAQQTEILAGDTDQQLKALWYHFSLGRSAGDPSGLRSEPSILKVADETMTYRGRSGVAGYRGIAVGFPGGMSYAFNAQNGALSAIWQGGFVRVGWQGQGSGNFDPVGKPVQLAQDVAFLRISNKDDVWPLRPRTSKEQPVNPDPLYPRNHGYAFLGYSLDASSIPTFQYRCGPVVIDDKSVASSDAGTRLLRRTLRFTTPADVKVWFRALTGEIDPESQTVFTTPDLRMTISQGTTVLRPGPDDDRELLIELTLPKGESTFNLDYELLR